MKYSNPLLVIRRKVSYFFACLRFMKTPEFKKAHQDYLLHLVSQNYKGRFITPEEEREYARKKATE